MLPGCVLTTETRSSSLAEKSPTSDPTSVIGVTLSPTVHDFTLTPEPTMTSTVTPSPTNTPKCPTIYAEDRDRVSIFTDMEFDHNGVLWLAGLDGITQWHPQTGLVARYTLSDGLTSDYIRAIAIDLDGNIWAAAHVGCVLSFDGVRWIPEHRAPSITSLVVAPNGFLWVSGYEPGAVYFYDGITWTNYIRLIDENNQRYIWGVTSLIVLENGDVWVAENCCMSPTRLYSLSTFKDASEEGHPTYLGRMIAGPDGSFWMTARWSETNEGEMSRDESGIARYDPFSDRWSSYTIPAELLEKDYDASNSHFDLYRTMVSPPHEVRLKSGDSY